MLRCLTSCNLLGNFSGACSHCLHLESSGCPLSRQNCSSEEGGAVVSLRDGKLCGKWRPSNLPTQSGRKKCCIYAVTQLASGARPLTFHHLILEVFFWLASCQLKSWSLLSSLDNLCSCIFHVAATNGKSCTAIIIAH